MTITFFSNFLNHHQLPLCQALYNILGEDFHFIATVPFQAGEVSQAGYIDMNEKYPFCVPAYRGETEAEFAKRLGENSDVVLSGGVADSWIAPRLRANKLTFRVAERPFKPMNPRFSSPYVLAAMLWRNTRYKRKNVYLLSCGEWAARDFAKIGAYRGKAFRWGYFPAVSEQVSGKKSVNPVRLLWVGRMLDWKRPDWALETFSFLRQKGIQAQLVYIGEGPEREKLEKQASGLENAHDILFLGPQGRETVQAEMEKADIFLFTSNENEGWGAVLNEAMASSCAVLASRAAGATNFLVQDGKNGFCFTNKLELFQHALELAQNSSLRCLMGCAARETMIQEWNGEQAAKRLVALSEALQQQKKSPFSTGVCSGI